MNQENEEKLKDDHVLNVLLCAIAIPLSMSMWIGNIIYSKFIAKNDGFDGKVSFSKEFQSFKFDVYKIFNGPTFVFQNP